MIYKKYFPAVVAGFAAAVLAVVPVLTGFACCMIVPFAAHLSIQLYKKINNIQGRIFPKEAILFGLFTGIVAAFFNAGLDTLATYFVRSNDFTVSLPAVMTELENTFKFPPEQYAMLERMSFEIKEYGFSLLYTIMAFVGMAIVYPITGVIGAAISMMINNKKSDVQ